MDGKEASYELTAQGLKGGLDGVSTGKVFLQMLACTLHELGTLPTMLNPVSLS